MISGELNVEARDSLFEHIKESARKSGRSGDEITVVAVTKAFPVRTMLSAFEGGFRALGESRLQETEVKIPDYPYRADTVLHLIGHLQKNKVKKAVDLYDVIETVDSFSLAKKINRIAAEAGKQQSVYLQVNAGRDPAKHGFSEEEMSFVGEELQGLRNLQISGIMTIAPFTNKESILRNTFSLTRDLREKLFNSGYKSCTALSMGMSSDYQLAIEEGATHVRIGTALFGARN